MERFSALLLYYLCRQRAMPATSERIYLPWMWRRRDAARTNRYCRTKLIPAANETFAQMDRTTILNFNFRIFCYYSIRFYEFWSIQFSARIFHFLFDFFFCVCVRMGASVSNWITIADWRIRHGRSLNLSMASRIWSANINRTCMFANRAQVIFWETFINKKLYGISAGMQIAIEIFLQKFFHHLQHFQSETCEFLSFSLLL